MNLTLLASATKSDELLQTFTNVVKTAVDPEFF